MERAELENEVWHCAARSYGQSLQDVIRGVLHTYARPPGHDDMTRLYRTSVGDAAFRALQVCLNDDWGNDDPLASVLWVRQHKRDYLYYCVLHRLVSDQLATDEMRDTRFAVDLGL